MEAFTSTRLSLANNAALDKAWISLVEMGELQDAALQEHLANYKTCFGMKGKPVLHLRQVLHAHFVSWYCLNDIGVKK